MKTLATGLQDHLDSGATTLAWCWKITRTDGEVFGFTDHDQVLSFASCDFEPDSGLSASDMKQDSALAVDAQDAEGVLSSDTISETDILDGLWDGADVEIWRVNWANVAQRVLLRKGTTGQLRRGRVAFRAEMRSLAHTLNQPVGRVYMATCDAVLGDTRCGVDLDDAAYKGTGSVTTLPRPRAFYASGLGAFDAEMFTHGLLTWTSGDNDGRRAAVARHSIDATGVLIVLSEEPLRAIAGGNTFTIVAGCDKRVSTCETKFANVVNFRGFPDIPGQDTLFRYFARSDGSGDVR